MENLLYGILTIILCFAGYSFSWKFQMQDKYRLAVLLLLLCGLALRIYTSADFFLHAWDERYHALVAKHLIHHPLTPTLYEHPVLAYDYKNWLGNHIWLHKQPLPLWGMAASLWMFGTNEFALRLPSIILSITGIWLTFSIGSYFFNKKVGYLAAFLYSINGLIIELTAGRVATDHIDIFFLFFIELAIFFSIRFVQKKNTVYNILTGLSIGAAVLSKWLPALIVLPVWLLIVADSGKFRMKTMVFQFLLLLVTTVSVFLPWQLYIFDAFPLEAKWESGLNLKHLYEVIEGRTGPFYFYIDQIRINYGDLIYLPLVWFLWKTFRNLKNAKNLAITTWFLLPLLFFSFAKTKMQAYILFTSPALFMITADFFYMLVDYKKQHRPKWVFNLILVLLIALPVRYTIERTKAFQKRDRHPQWVANLKELNKKKITKGILFNYDKPIEAMFYTDLTAYRIIPDKNTITELTEKGYTIIINDDGNIPDSIKKQKKSKTYKITKLKIN